jgi:hypothetical protein
MWQLTHGNFLDHVEGTADKSVDHTIMDPPYEVEAHKKGRRLSRTWAEKERNIHHVVEKEISYPPITEEERRAAAWHAARITRRWILVFCQIEAAMLWRAELEKGGAQYWRTGIYWKLDAQPQVNGQGPGQGYEAIVIAHGLPRKGPRRWNGGGKCARWEACSDARFGHTLEIDGQKPRQLMIQLVEDFTDRGETVADFYSGYATTGVACIETGRHFVGYERDLKNYKKALRRLQGIKEQLHIETIGKTMKQVSLFG